MDKTDIQWVKAENCGPEFADGEDCDSHLCIIKGRPELSAILSADSSKTAWRFIESLPVGFV